METKIDKNILNHEIYNNDDQLPNLYLNCFFLLDLSDSIISFSESEDEDCSDSI